MVKLIEIHTLGLLVKFLLIKLCEYLSIDMRFHFFNNLIGMTSSILKKLIDVLRGIVIGQRACNILCSKTTFKALPLTNENTQFRLIAK